jgi:hypothetical protein
VDIRAASQIILSGFCMITIIAGVVVILKLQTIGILHSYVLEIIGLTFLAPFVLLLSFFSLISADAASGLAGAMVGYFFRAGRAALSKSKE